MVTKRKICKRKNFERIQESALQHKLTRCAFGDAFVDQTYLHSLGAYLAASAVSLGEVPATAEAPAAKHFHSTMPDTTALETVGLGNALTASAVRVNGTNNKSPPPAAAVVVIFTTPLSLSMVMLLIFFVAVGGVNPA